LNEACVDLPRDLLGNYAPRLQRLALIGCSVSWDSPLFDNLTSLYIEYPAVCGLHDCLSYSSLLALLQRLPHLRNLALIDPPSGPLPIETALPSLEEGSISLLSLCNLKYRGTYSLCVWLLKLLLIPPTARVKLTIYASLLLKDFHVIASFLGLRTSTLQSMLIKIVSTSRSCQTLDVKGWCCQIDKDIWDPFSTAINNFDVPIIDLQLVWYGPSPIDHWQSQCDMDCVAELTEAFDLGQVLRLFVSSTSFFSHSSGISSEQWKTMSQHFPKVLELGVENQAAYEISEVLSARKVSDNADNTKDKFTWLYFPELAELTLRNVNCRYWMEYEQTNFGNVLGDNLEVRCLRGPVNKLVVSGCSVTCDFIRQVNRFVYLVWDGDGASISDEDEDENVGCGCGCERGRSGSEDEVDTSCS
jgi:hypothetical protein